VPCFQRSGLKLSIFSFFKLSIQIVSSPLSKYFNIKIIKKTVKIRKIISAIFIFIASKTQETTSQSIFQAQL